MAFFYLTGLVIALVSLATAQTTDAGRKTCKCFPGDECWPSEPEWDRFNQSVGGRLIKTVPLGSPCHGFTYDAAQCEELQSEWQFPGVHINSSSSVQAPIFANASCDPFTAKETPCLPGNYVRYAVKVSGPSDIAATIKFAEAKNIRLVIRNTAHDYVGRSTGAGGLAIWTHFLRGVEVKDWSDGEYTGKAVKLAAGALGADVLEAASAAGLVVVTGECPTVGIAGGYTQSGGHSPLSTAFGLSADNTLEFEVVTADGQLVTANPFSPEHADLFWALSGSGAGNYGVVVSVTLKAHPDATTSAAGFSIQDPRLDYSAVLNAWHAALPRILESGAMATYYADKAGLVVYTLTGYDRTQTDLQQALDPFIRSLASMDISLRPNYTQFASYHEHYTYYYGPLPTGHFGVAGELLMGGRLLLRDALPDVGPAINATLQRGVRFIGQAANVTRFAAPRRRAVLPQWRDAVVMSAYTLPASSSAAAFADMRAAQDRITHTVMPLIERATPDAGAYINEADFQQPDWQRVFFGDNYPRLALVKQKYDPQGLFYNSIAVGSERWRIEGDGRMCEA